MKKLANATVTKLREYSQPYGAPETIEVSFIKEFDNEIQLFNSFGAHLRTMRNGIKFTAIYDTETMKNVGYSTIAKDLDHALKFFRSYISSPIKKVIRSSTWFSDPNGKDTVVYEA